MRLGVDVGGTFTDLLLHDEKTQRTFQAKTPSTPEDQSIGVAAGVKLICEKAGISPSDIDLILHGTTVATNAVLEGKGARVGLLVTEGFEYTLHLAKAWTPGPLFGWINMDKPDPLASLADTRGISERMNARGEVVKPLDIAGATKLIDDLCGSGIEALTISLMHSYANAEHERALRDIVAARHPNIPVSLSSDILPEFREYDRAITTVMNDYVRPIMRRYLSRIEDRLKAEGVRARLHIVRSDGGLMSAAAASERPVHTVLSGPAGGVTSTVMLSRRSGFSKLLAFDMGGTSRRVGDHRRRSDHLALHRSGHVPRQGADAGCPLGRRGRRLHRRRLRTHRLAPRRSAFGRCPSGSGLLRPRWYRTGRERRQRGARLSAAGAARR
jgi:N-methylhydantoinase A